MNFQKRNVFKFLFIVYFLLYIVSPLCYADGRLSEDTTIAHGAKQDSKNICVIWGVILSKLLQKENSENNNSGVQLIVKKARAVLNSNNIVKTAYVEFEASNFNNLSHYVTCGVDSLSLANPKIQIGFYLSFSGLSPPAV